MGQSVTTLSMATPISVICPYGPRASTCGYCGSHGGRSLQASSYTFGIDPLQLSCSVYQMMIDRGLRRSGTYLYKPDLARSCCPQYTIRMDTRPFAPSKGQRQTVNRFNKFVMGDKKPVAPTPKRASKGKNNEKYDLLEEIRSAEFSTLAPDVAQEMTHKYEVTFEAPTCTQEKYALYEKYQKNIHLDKSNSMGGFKRFLCDTPLRRQGIQFSQTPPAYLPQEYGSYHMMFRLDGESIGMGVVDVLPHCVSSVYFMYDPKWEQHSLGKLSALWEISLAQELSKHGAAGLDYLYMGFYIHTCQKMKYKGQYSPSFLLEPEEYTWHPLAECEPLLDKYHYVPFAHPSRASRPIDRTESTSDDMQGESGDLDEEDNSAPPGVTVPPALINEIKIVNKFNKGNLNVKQAIQSKYWASQHERDLIMRAVSLLGEDLTREVIFITSDLMY